MTAKTKQSGGAKARRMSTNNPPRTLTMPYEAELDATRRAITPFVLLPFDAENCTAQYGAVRHELGHPRARYPAAAPPPPEQRLLHRNSASSTGTA